MKKGDEIVVKLEKFADRGKSLARIDNYVVFVSGAVPGDTVKARVFRKRKKFAEAKLLEVIEPSAMRIEARCKHHDTCGGCKWQHVQYESQLEAKRESVQDAMRIRGGFEAVEVQPVIPADEIFNYRNKMEFTFSSRRWLTDREIATGEDLDRSFALGLHAPGRFDGVMDLDECHLQGPTSVKIVNGMRALALKKKWKPWNIREHKGFLRHLVIRTSHAQDEVMVNLVTSRFDQERMTELTEWFKQEMPEVTTLVNTVNSGVAQTAYGEAMHTIFGTGQLTDSIGGRRFEIAPNAFFQTNTAQAEKLYQVAKEFAELKPTDHVYDLYCGAGTISLFLADAVERVTGIELIEEAVVNARANAKANGVTNCTFITGDMKPMFSDAFVKEHGRPDVLLVDPPRAGMHPKVVKTIGQLRPERFVYVSCNPNSQAADLKELASIYKVDAVQPVDLFPHTHHIESVAKLSLK